MRRQKKLLLFIFMLSTTFAQWEYPGDVTLIGSEETVFDWQNDSCEWDNTPDAPPRVWRDAEDNINLTIGHYTTYRMKGTSFNSLSMDCSEPIHTSNENTSDPSRHNGSEWLSAVYTEDGITIHGIVHNEYHGFTSGECPDPSDCAYTSLTYAVSTDGGQSFEHPEVPDHLIVAVDTATPGNRYGVIEPTNIIKHDGYYYFIAEAWGANVERAPYIFRTADLSDPSSWSGWDGSGFNIITGNPYDGTVDYSQMKPLNKDTPWEGNTAYMHGSLTYNTYFNKFMLIGTTAKGSQWGVYYSLSEDLINWSQRILVKSFTNASVGQGDPSASSTLDHVYYATIIDHDDTSRNFENPGQNVYLYYAVFTSQADAGDNYPYDRRLVRQQIQFSKRLVDGLTVTRAGDSEDIYPGDGIAATQYGHASLRSVLMESRYRPPYYADSLLTINFGFTNSNYIITPSAHFLGPTFPVAIDATTADGYTENSNAFNQGINRVYGAELTGESALLFLEGAGSSVKGLKVSSIAIYSGDNRIEACDVGTLTIGGTTNTRIGGSGQISNRIDHVVVESGSEGTVIQGNYISCDSEGLTSAGSSHSGILIKDSVRNTVIENNLVSGAGYAGIGVAGSGVDSVIISGNLVGTDRTGSGTLPNNAAGIRVFNNAVGIMISGNTVSGNAGEAGIYMDNISDVRVEGNYIGTDNSGNSVGNDGHGIWISGSSFGNQIGSPGAGNTIAFNGGDGVSQLVLTGSGNTISSNTIFSNSGPGISSPHYDLAVPDLTSAIINEAADSVTIYGYFEGSTVGSHRVEVFQNSSCDSSGSGEGETFLGYMDIVANSSGDASYSGQFGASITSGQFVTATLTDSTGSTSPFSPCRVAFKKTESPQISLSDTGISFTYTSNESPIGTEYITVFNGGQYELEWVSSTDSDWLLLEPASGTVDAGDSAIVGVTVYALGFDQGNYNGSVTINSNAGNSPVMSVAVSLSYGSTAGEPDLAILPDTLDLVYQYSGTISYQESISVTNNGGEAVNWFATSNQGWLSGITPSSGSIAAGATGEIVFTITLNESMSSGSFTAILVLHTSHPGGDNYPREIIVNLTVSTSGAINHAPNDFQLLEPPAGQVLSVTAGTFADSLQFSWTKADDPDGDSITYNLVLSSWAMDTVRMETRKTTAALDWKQINTNLFQTLEDTATLEWSVTASDGSLTRASGPASLVAVKWKLTLSEPEVSFTSGGGVWHPGDTVSIVYSLSNQGPVNFDLSLTAELTSTVDGVDLFSGTGELAGIAAGGTGQLVFKAALLPVGLDSTTVDFSLNVFSADCESSLVPVCIDTIMDDISLEVSVLSLNSRHLPEIPNEYALKEAYPNPFNPETTIQFSVPENGFMTLKVYNIMGQEVRTLVDNFMVRGYHSVVWDGTDDSGASASGGVYLYRINANGYSKTMKMILLK